MALQFTAEQKAAYRAAYAPGATNELFDLFIIECERRELIPGKDVIFQTRTSNEYNQALNRTVAVTRPALITTIGALRLIASRTGQMDGYGVFKYWYGMADAPGKFEAFDIPQGRIPHAVTVEIFRKDWSHSVKAVARYDAYVQKKSNGDVTSMWEKRGEEQLAKCAEALGLKMIAPEEAGGLLISEEISNQETPLEQLKEAAGVAGHCVPAEQVVVPQPTVAPAVNQAPAPTPAPVATPTQTGPVAVPVVVAPAPAPAAPVMVRATVKPVGPPRPVSGPPRPAPTPAHPIPNRQPAVDEPVRETPAEIKEVADAVARDKDPKPAPAPAAPVVTPPVPAVPVAVAVEGAPTREELAAFKGRAGKILRDKLEKEGGWKGSSKPFMEFIQRVGGNTDLAKIQKAKWEEILSGLEAATPQAAVAIVKG
jgi:hypothetical protein